MTLPDLRRNLEKSMLVSQVQRAEVNDKISVTEEEAKAYYAEHAKEFTTPSEVTLREILIEVPTTDKGVNVAQDDEVKAQGRGDPRAAAGGRAVSAAGRRLLGRAVAGQRRASSVRSGTTSWRRRSRRCSTRWRWATSPSRFARRGATSC